MLQTVMYKLNAIHIFFSHRHCDFLIALYYDVEDRLAQKQQQVNDLQLRLDLCRCDVRAVKDPSRNIARSASAAVLRTDSLQTKAPLNRSDANPPQNADASSLLEDDWLMFPALQASMSRSTSLSMSDRIKNSTTDLMELVKHEHAQTTVTGSDDDNCTQTRRGNPVVYNCCSGAIKRKEEPTIRMCEPDKHETVTKKMHKKTAAPGFQILLSNPKLHQRSRIPVAITKDEQRSHEKNVHDESIEITTRRKVNRIRTGVRQSLMTDVTAFHDDVMLDRSVKPLTFCRNRTKRRSGRFPAKSKFSAECAAPQLLVKNFEKPNLTKPSESGKLKPSNQALLILSKHPGSTSRNQQDCFSFPTSKFDHRSFRQRCNAALHS